MGVKSLSTTPHLYLLDTATATFKNIPASDYGLCRRKKKHLTMSYRKSGKKSCWLCSKFIYLKTHQREFHDFFIYIERTFILKYDDGQKGRERIRYLRTSNSKPIG